MLEKADERMFEDKRQRRASAAPANIFVLPVVATKEADAQKSKRRFRRNVAKSRGVKFHALAETWDTSCVSDPEDCRKRLYLYQWMIRSRPSSKLVRARKPNSR